MQAGFTASWRWVSKWTWQKNVLQQVMRARAWRVDTGGGSLELCTASYAACDTFDEASMVYKLSRPMHTCARYTSYMPN